MTDISDRYDPRRVEAHWYREWEERGYFHADAASPKKPYSIVIPPPNVTGSLHWGHALNNTLQDILIRWKRMDGRNALWVPGTAHAGIATQYVVERQLAAEGKTKEDLGREAFLAWVWKWKDESGGIIINQLKRLGASCDWRRERFTMDAGLSTAVREVFVRLWEEGLVYQGDYIVNWCPRCQTVLSDLEVEREERDAEFVYIRYGPLTLGTVRPETKLGDTALAVHPKDNRYAVGVCYRCKTVVEPLISTQWYVRTKPLAEAAIKAVRSGRIRIVPRAWTKTYYHWMENIRDWAISRQLWWGHRIPAWYCDAEGTVHVSRTHLAACPGCGGALRQDSDVLDTWFSSGLWPFSTLGWPDQTEDLRTFYPTACLATGFDILFFWVARMAMLGIKFMGDVPFRDVYIHALVRDAEGAKMSKSKGNVADPLMVMEKYGTDAFRFTLAALAAQGRDIRMSEDRIEGYRNFANKIWNAARLVLTNLDGYDPRLAKKGTPSVADRWITSRLQAATKSVRRALDTYRFNDAASAVYQFLWHEFCDWYLEIAKQRLYQTVDPAARAVTQRTLVETLEATLRLLHPFMPFISEEIWQRLPHAGPSVMIAPFPRARGRAHDAAAEARMAAVIAIVSGVRNVRSESRIPPGTELRATVRPGAGSDVEALREAASLMGTLARAAITVDPTASRPAHSAVAVADGCEVYVELEGVVDLGAERQRVLKEIDRASREITFFEGKLSRQDFVERAPADVVARGRGFAGRTT